jgi:hypothetical protein
VLFPSAITPHYFVFSLSSFFSTVFLVNFALLLLWSVGLSIHGIIQQDGANAGAQTILSILAYVGVVVCSCILASQHTALEDPKVAVAYAVPIPLDDETPSGGAGNHQSYRYDSLGEPVVDGSEGRSAAAVAVPVPLGGQGFV